MARALQLTAISAGTARETEMWPPPRVASGHLQQRPFSASREEGSGAGDHRPDTESFDRSSGTVPVRINSVDRADAVNPGPAIACGPPAPRLVDGLPVARRSEVVDVRVRVPGRSGLVNVSGSPQRQLRDGHQQRQHHAPASAQQRVGSR